MPSELDPQVKSAYLHFRGWDHRTFRGRRRLNWPYRYAPRAKDCYALARAEVEASDRSFTFEWVPDSDIDWSGHEDWCLNARRDAAHRDPSGRELETYSRYRNCDGHENYGCILRDSTGRKLESLWGILDPDDDDYRRMTEAELAAAALYTIHATEKRDAEILDGILRGDAA